MRLSVDQTQQFLAMKILWEHDTLILAALSRICLMIDFVVAEGCMKSMNFFCSIRVFHYKVTVLLESIELRSYVQCIWVLFCSLNISLTALLDSSVDLF